MPQLLAGPGESCIRVHNEQIDGVNGGGRKRGKRKREGRKKEEKRERLIEGMKYALFATICVSFLH